VTTAPRRIRRPWIWTDRAANTADVSRAGLFGNPYIVGPDGDPATVVTKYRTWATDPDAQPMKHTTGSGKTRSINPPAAVGLHRIRGKDLACYCPLDQPCHADVLLELANRDDRMSRP
jgi:Domain of unknown function (DUF4326)